MASLVIGFTLTEREGVLLLGSGGEGKGRRNAARRDAGNGEAHTRPGTRINGQGRRPMSQYLYRENTWN